MGVYYPSFNYMGINSLKDKKLIVTAFDADNGEVETFLGMEPIYTESSDGSRRIDYGAKFNSVAVIKISVIKASQKDFTVAEVRDFLKWTTGAKQNSYLDLLVNDEVKFSFLGRVTNAYQQKLDARTIGLAIEFTSVSPWAYSPKEVIRCSFGQDLTLLDGGILSKGGEDNSTLSVDSNGVFSNGSTGLFQITSSGVIHIDNAVRLQIDNKTDDLYSYITLDTKITNQNSSKIIIQNKTMNEDTIISNIVDGEVITLSSNKFITSDNTTRTFGNSFNFVWPRLAPGVNIFEISGDGVGYVDFIYRYPIKIGDCAIDIDVLCSDIDGNGLCDDGEIATWHPISWNDIIGQPNTLGGYGIIDAYPINAVYNKNEIDQRLADIETEVDSVAYLASNISSELTNDYYNSHHIDDNFYNKIEIDNIVSNINVGSSNGGLSSVMWSTILDKPTTLSGYGVKSEVQNMIDAISIEIDECDLTTMLNEILV